MKYRALLNGCQMKKFVLAISVIALQFSLSLDPQTMFTHGVFYLHPPSVIHEGGELNADQFEAELIDIFNLGGLVHKETAAVNGHTYSLTTVGSNVFGTTPYFRAGDFFVINPHLFVTASVLDDGDNSRTNEKRITRLEKLLKNYSKHVFLQENHEPMRGWVYYTHKDFFTSGWDHWDEGTPYFLPSTIGIIIAMQEYQDSIRNHPFVDLGSRNALLTNVALKLGASKAIIIEKDLDHIEFVGVPIQERFGLPELFGDLITLNLRLNGHEGKASIYIKNFPDGFAVTELKNGVVAFNLPHFSIPPLAGGPAYELDREYGNISHLSEVELNRVLKNLNLDSILQSILDKFPGVQLVIAGGGHEQWDEENLDLELKRLDLMKIGRIPVPVFSRGYPLENEPDSYSMNTTIVCSVNSPDISGLLRATETAL